MDNIFEKEKKYFLPTYNRIPIDLSHGKGVYLFAKNGDKYLDFFSGLGVNALGYAHPAIVEAVTKQITLFGHLSNNYITDIQVEFAELLLKHSQMDKLFLTNSGTESIEGAIKLIRKKYGREKKIFALTNSFHGRTYGAMSLTARSKYRDGFQPLLPGIEFINFNDVEDLTNKISEDTAGIFVEFIQGEGGINLISQQFADQLKELKNKFDFALVSDCIQCGIGRTGMPFSHNYLNMEPDIITSAKAIGGGLPLGAILTSKEYSNIFDVGKHGTTFGGNSVSCAAGKVVLEEVFEKGLMKKVASNGKYLFNRLLEIQNRLPEKIKEVRGRGYMVGVELSIDSSHFVKEMRERKVLANVTNVNVVRLLPPLIVELEHIDYFVEKFEEVIKLNLK